MLPLEKIILFWFLFYFQKSKFLHQSFSCFHRNDLDYIVILKYTKIKDNIFDKPEKPFQVIFLGYLVIAASSDDLVEEEAKQEERLEKSLLNSFPFNAGERSEHHGDHHEEHHGEHEEDETPNLRQLVALSRSAPQARYGVEEPPAQDGKKCVQKVMMVEELIWDDVVTCDHSYDKRCHMTYKTSFDSVQEEECEENFRKTCFITMVDTAMNVTQNVCKKPMVKDCDIEGEPVCRTEYQSECWSKQIPHEVR